MSYEVFVNVRHHPKHGDEAERQESTAFKFSDPQPGEEETAALVHVVNALRAFASEIDPRTICTNCRASRGDHFREGKHLYRCFNRMGPITQSAWWETDS